jgi:predicted secreted protein
MSDFTALNQVASDLQAAVTAAGANMDKLFADLQAAMNNGDQPMIDAAVAAFQAQVDALKAVVSNDPAP